jgi:hypothetical protein
MYVIPAVKNSPRRKDLLLTNVFTNKKGGIILPHVR